MKNGSLEGQDELAITVQNLDKFRAITLPHLKWQDGSKAPISDNLGPHISLEVIRLCRENEIKFIYLPPNSMPLTQPLDIAYFWLLKIQW
jgi:hypothetical protein